MLSGFDQCQVKGSLCTFKWKIINPTKLIVPILADNLSYKLAYLKTQNLLTVKLSEITIISTIILDIYLSKLNVLTIR